MRKLVFVVTALMLVACSSKQVDPKKAISDLLYQDQIAWSTSIKTGLDFQLKNTYPGTIDIAKAKDCISSSVSGSRYGVADFSTLRKDPEWIPPLISPESIQLSSPPKGDTYIVTVSDNGTQNQVHFTILDGKTYYYPTFCS